MGLFDLHSHLLPGVDDGAATEEKSIDLARKAVSEGISHLVLTPHHFNNQYVNHKEDVIKATEALQSIYRKLGISLQVFPSQEIRIQEDLGDNIAYSDDYLSLDTKGKYYLIEMPTKTVPKYALDVCKDMISNGMIPVIAHPERNHQFAGNIRTLYPFIEAGCLGQLTSHSYIGLFGDKLRKVSKEMIEHNLVHLIASDAHHIKQRPFNLKEAYQQLEAEYGLRLVEYYQQNAEAIFNGQSFNRLQPKLKKRFGLF